MTHFPMSTPGAHVEALTGMDPFVVTEEFRRAGLRLREAREVEALKLSELASLRAQFYGGQTSHYDHERKALLAELIEANREVLEEKGVKYTEAGLDSYAHAHPTYRRWLDEQHRRREDMHVLEAELAQARADIEAAQGEVEYHRQRLRLVEEMIRLARTERGLP